MNYWIFVCVVIFILWLIIEFIAWLADSKYGLLITSVTAIILWFTCPEKYDHQEVVNDKIDEVCDKDSSLKLINHGLKIVNVKESLFGVYDYQSYYFFSIAKIDFYVSNKSKYLTFGILGKVFLIPTDWIKL